MVDYTLVLTSDQIDRFALMAKRARHEEADLWAAAGIVRGASIVDLGCGPGQTLVELADVVGGDGRVVGIDTDLASLKVAQSTIKARGMAHASLRHASADRTGLAPSTFDVAMIRHVLAHNGGREHAIVGHAAELVRPGGRVYLVDVGPTVVRMTPHEPNIDELMTRYASFLRAQGNDPHIGVRLTEVLEASGLEVVATRHFPDVVETPPGIRPPAWAARARMVAAGHATSEDVKRWSAALERSDRTAQRPVLFAPLDVAVGLRRP